MKYILFITLLFQLSCKEDQEVNDNRLFKTLEEAQKHLEANREYEMIKGCRVIAQTRIIEFMPSLPSITVDPIVELLKNESRYLTIPDSLVRSVVFGDTKAVDCLLEAKHDPNVRDATVRLSERPNSVLFWAVFKNFPEIVKLLIEAGADVHEKNEDGIPFLLRKADFLEHTEVAKILKAHGAK